MNLFVLVVVCTICYALGVKVSPTSNGIELLGRFNANNEADWPSSGVRFWVRATESQLSAQVSYDGVSENFLMYTREGAGCSLTGKVAVAPAGPQSVFNLTATKGQVYELEFFKVTEASNGNAVGTMKISDISISGGEFVEKKQGLEELATQDSNCFRPRHKLLMFGDSISCGYGVDCASPDLHFSADTEDVTHAYPYLVAQNLQADLQVVAWSGKGVVRNYGDENQISTNPLPTYYNKTLATGNIPLTQEDPNYYDPAHYPADIVTVMLGTNDYSTQPNPSDEQFIGGLVDLIQRIKKDYPRAHGRIAVMCAPMRTGKQCDNIASAAKREHVLYVDVDPSTLSGGYGCDYHPNQASQLNMANYITSYLQKLIKQE